MSVRRAEDLEARMVVLTAFVNGIIFELDRDGRYLAVWTGEPELLVAPAPELEGKNVVDFLGPELGGVFVDLIRRVIDSGVPETFDYTLDVPAGSRSFHCEARRTPRGSASAAPATATLLVRDVTDEVELRAKLFETDRLAAMGLVAASVGHEIRQPLAFATTSLEVLARELEGDRSPRVKEALEHVRDAVRRIGSIAASVGMVSGRRKNRATDVARAIEAALDLCASELRGRARVVIDLPQLAELPRVAADEGELCQVLTNLLLNAAHASEPAADGSRSRIEIRAEHDREREQVVLWISDEGSGIDPSNLARVFDPFFTTKEPGRGTGLGLFLSRRMVEDAGGTLAIEPREEKGTTVTVRLGVAGPESVAPISVPESWRNQRLELLVVDDEPSFLRSLELLLEDMHDVVVASRGADALAMVEAEPNRFDAILCDLSMPDVDGVSFHRSLVALGLEQRFILMSAGAFTPERDEFFRTARCKRIVKPFTLEQLVAVLAEVTDPTGTPVRS